MIDLVPASGFIPDPGNSFGNTVAADRVRAQVLDITEFATAGEPCHDGEKLDHAIGVEVRVMHQLNADAISLIFILTRKVDHGLLTRRNTAKQYRRASL